MMTVLYRDYAGLVVTEHNAIGYDQWDFGRTVHYGKGGDLNANAGTPPSTNGGSGYIPSIAYSHEVRFGSPLGVIQGIRVSSPATGTWTTPDAYAGTVHDPMSQKPYIWNRNNPFEYSDPSGYNPNDDLKDIPYVFKDVAQRGYLQKLAQQIRGALHVPANAPQVSEANAAHMFRSATGHIPDTALNRAMLQRVASEPAFRVSLKTIREGGTLERFAARLPGGKEVWVEVRDGSKITNGGVNNVPEFNSLPVKW